MTPIELISFDICPFVQRSVITLEAKQVPYNMNRGLTDRAPLLVRLNDYLFQKYRRCYHMLLRQWPGFHHQHPGAGRFIRLTLGAQLINAGQFLNVLYPSK